MPSQGKIQFSEHSVLYEMLIPVVEHSRYDLSYKYFLGMMPEDDVIDPSSLCKFRRMRLKYLDLLDMLINKTVRLRPRAPILILP